MPVEFRHARKLSIPWSMRESEKFALRMTLELSVDLPFGITKGSNIINECFGQVASVLTSTALTPGVWKT